MGKGKKLQVDAFIPNLKTQVQNLSTLLQNS